MIKKFFIDDQNNFVFQSIVGDDEHYPLNEELSLKEITLSVNKRCLLDTIKMLCKNRKYYKNITLNSVGVVNINTLGQTEFTTEGLAEISIIEGETFELFFFAPSFNLWIPMREFMPYDLIDFIDEHK